MLRCLVPLISLLILTSLPAIGQSDSLNTSTGEPTVIQGRVVDLITGEPIFGASIQVKGNIMGTLSMPDGSFELLTDKAPPLTLTATIYGYLDEEMEITKKTNKNVEFQMLEDIVFGEEVVVSASRFDESIMESPVTIEQMDIRDIQKSTTVSFYESIANMKAVDQATVGVLNRVYNTRGFNSALNYRFVQRIDGMDNQLPGLNIAPSNFIGVSELDIERVELIPGASSALYGANAFNGVLNMSTKSPFLYPGLSASVKSGVSMVHDRELGEEWSTRPAPFYQAAFRYSRQWKDKVGFKINMSYRRAEDFHASSHEDVNDANLVLSLPRGPNNPGHDLLNWYGDEATNSSWISPSGQHFHPLLGNTSVSKTGYFEEDLMDYDVENYKADAALHYRLSEDYELIGRAKYGWGTTPIMSASRYNLKNFQVQQYSAELRHDQFFVKAFTTLESSGDAYDTRFLGLNMGRYRNTPDGLVFDADNSLWFEDYGSKYEEVYSQTNEALQAHTQARSFADRYRVEPGSALFNDLKDSLVQIADPRFGAQFLDRSKLYSLESQYRVKALEKYLDVLVGAQYRVFDLNSQGTLFPDTAGNDISMQEWGAYIQLRKKLWEEKLTLQASLRADKNENFDAQYSPRASAVYEFLDNNFLRVSAQRAFRIPSVQEQFVNLNIGSIILKGGLPGITRGLNLYGPQSNAYTLQSVQRFSDSVSAYVAEYGSNSASQAVVRYQDALDRAHYDHVQPETVNAFEMGYKSLFFDKKLMFDVNYYINIYDHFLGTARVVTPRTPLAVDEATGAFELTSEDTRQAYQLYTNSRETVTAHGAGLSANYKIKDFVLQGNFSWNRLITEEDDPVLPAFNTPEYKTNIQFGNRKIVENLGFNLVWRWQSEFKWQGTFTETERYNVVPAFMTFDAQVNYRMPDSKLIAKLGANNLLNQRYIQMYGGPQIGAIYYISLTFDEFFNY